jgi:surface antigen
MTSAHKAAAAALAIALAGCHAIYGNDKPAATSADTPPAAAAPAVDASKTGAPAGISPGGSGTTAGAVGAGLPASTVAGTLAGGYFGSRLGSRFDDSARQAAATAERRALADNAPADWSDPQSGASGRVRPLRSFIDAAGRRCREYSATVNIAGRRDSDTGIACVQSGGDWSLVGG